MGLQSFTIDIPNLNEGISGMLVKFVDKGGLQRWVSKRTGEQENVKLPIYQEN